MHFTHLSRNNPYHIYSIEHDKIVRDDFKMNFQHPDLIKCDYITLPYLETDEVKAIILDLKEDIRFKDMMLGFCINIYTNPKYIKSGNKTEKVKELLKFIKREDKGIYL